MWGQRHLLRGQILDARTTETLPGANIVIQQTGAGTVSDSEGYFELRNVRSGMALMITYVGYQSHEHVIQLPKDAFLDVALTPLVIEQKEVLIRGERPLHEKAEMGQVTLTREEIEAAPRFLGEADPMKVLQLTPGIQTATEGDAGIYVRGGGPGQNLILLDEMLIHSPNHLLGIFSVFNPATTSSIELIKGGIPAEYGERLSSVIKVSSEMEPDTLFHGEATIGTVNTSAALQIPMKGYNKLTLGGRISQLSLYEKMSEWTGVNTSFWERTQYDLYDMNGLFRFRIGDKNYFSLAGMTNRDKYRYQNNTGTFVSKLNWGNTAGGFNWYYVVNPSYTIKQHAGVSNYQFEMTSAFREYNLNLFSEINDIYYKQQHLIQTNSLLIKTGFEYHKTRLMPDRIDADFDEQAVQQKAELHGHELAFYYQQEAPLSDRLRLNAGVRFTWFGHTGPYTSYEKNNAGQVVDTIAHGKEELLKQYLTIDPRLLLIYKLKKRNSLKASYTVTTQNIHLATISSVSLPTDIWLPSTVTIPPERAHQVSLGYYQSFSRWNFSTELYYKRLINSIEFAGGLLTTGDQKKIEENVLTGNGNAYGLELMLRKSRGKLTGWAAYTLARTDRKFDELNDGRTFPAKYDRRHDLSMVAAYKFSPRIKVAASFVYASGNAMTMPEGRYIIQGNIVNDYGKLNDYRVPPYHRLDLSLTWTLRESATWTSLINFSIYNVYNRHNTYFIYFDVDGDLDAYDLVIEPKQVALFPIIPSIAWTFKF